MSILSRNILLALAFSATSFAQEAAVSPGFAISLGVGTWPHFFRTPYKFNDPFTTADRTDLYLVSGGISYSPIHFVDKTKLSISLELLYGRSSTPPTRYTSSTTITMTEDMVFLAVWTKAYVPSTISPFARVGIGLFRTRLSEDFTPARPTWDNFVYHDTQLGLGAGGGIDWDVNEAFRLTFQLSGIVAPGKEVIGTRYFELASSVGL